MLAFRYDGALPTRKLAVWTGLGVGGDERRQTPRAGQRAQCEVAVVTPAQQLGNLDTLVTGIEVRMTATSMSAEVVRRLRQFRQSPATDVRADAPDGALLASTSNDKTARTVERILVAGKLIPSSLSVVNKAGGRTAVMGVTSLAQLNPSWVRPAQPVGGASITSAYPVFEEMAKRGRETLRFGPMKPIGLPVPLMPGLLGRR